MTETALFVGGKMDGKVMVLKKGVERVDIFPEGVLAKETYYRQTLYTGTKEIPIYLISIESPDSLIPLLIGGYREK